MASNYWIKLYHEILDDPKMGRLRDNLWRRVIECFLMAGETQADGFLPPLEDMAWRLRVNEEILESELGELANVGILERRDGLWFVSNFADRQSAMSASERAKRWREQQRKQEYYDDGTDTERDENENQTNRSQNRKEEEIEEEAELDTAAACRAFENGFGQTLTPILSGKIEKAVNKHGPRWVIDAIDEGVEYNARSWRYVETVLERWGREGRKDNGTGDTSGVDKEKLRSRVRAYTTGRVPWVELADDEQKFLRLMAKEHNSKNGMPDDLKNITQDNVIDIRFHQALKKMAVPA